jgi:hypothetical protein
LPNGIEKINDHTFGYCRGLTHIVLPDTITSIGECVFLHCESLKYIHLPSELKTVGENSFSGCQNLERIEIAESNPFYKIINGNLYTKDGKRLVLSLNKKVDN